MNNPNSQVNTAQQASFLKLVRTGAGVLGFKPTQGKFYEEHFDNEAQALALIEANGGQADTWVSMATYSDPKASRSQDNAEKLCSLWLDVDAHEGCKYKSVSEVEAAIDIFISQASQDIQENQGNQHFKTGNPF